MAFNNTYQIAQVILYDANGNIIVGSSGSASPTSGITILGSDGTNARIIKTANDGTVKIDPSGTTTQPVSGTITANQGTPSTLSNKWPVQITDGTNTMPVGDVAARASFNQITDGTNTAAIKPSSTAPITSDPALVVVMSPNQQSISVTTSPANSIPILAFGDITLSSNGSTVQINRTTYTEQSSNFTGSIVSSSANDTSAGTGARTITIYWMNSSGTTTGTETATLNGTTAVNLSTTTKCFIEKIIVNTVGTGKVNAGTITLWTGSGGTGTAVGAISIGDNRTFWCHHYIVSGKTCNVTNIAHSNTSSVSGGTSSSHIRSIQIGVANAAEVQVSDFVDVGGASNPSLRSYGSVIQVVGPARIAMYVLPAANTSTIYRGSIDCYDL